MSAVPQIDHQHLPQPSSDQQTSLSVHDPGHNAGGAGASLSADDVSLAAMVVGCGVFAVALAAFVVMPYMNLWLSL